MPQPKGLKLKAEKLRHQSRNYKEERESGLAGSPRPQDTVISSLFRTLEPTLICTAHVSLGCANLAIHLKAIHL